MSSGSTISAALVLGTAALFAVLACQPRAALPRAALPPASLSPASSSSRPPTETPHVDPSVTPTAAPPSVAPATLGAPGEPLGRVRLGVADGALPGGVTVFDAGYPGVANLDTDLLRAMREAATDAAGDGVGIYVTSGWRSPEFQRRLLREAIAEYGSEEEAARWVATPDRSTHVSGDAVDIGPSDAIAWLSERGAHYGLCQIYRNEPWHIELRPDAASRGCSPMYSDPTQDPRMQR